MKSNLLLSIGLFITIICVSRFDSKRIKACHFKKYENCFNPFFGIGKRPDATKLATTSDGLDMFCASFNKTMDCIDKQLRKCGNPLHKELWMMFTLTLQDYFRQDICFDTPFRKEYVKHGQCIEDHVMGVDEAIPCLNNYLLAFEYLATDQPHDFVATICCAHMRKEKCTDQLAREHCGLETEKIFREFFNKIHFGFFGIFCWNEKDFEVDSEVCKKELPNAGTKPKTPKSNSSIAKMLYKNFPFNYIKLSKRKKSISS